MTPTAALRTGPGADEAWPPGGLETLGRCPVCGESGRHMMYEGLTDRVFFCAPGRWTLWRCAGCRTAYLDPRPTPATIHLAYRDYFTHAVPEGRQTDGLSLSRRIRRALADGYRNWRYGTRRRPASGLGVAVAMLCPPLRRRLDVAFRYLPHPARTAGRRLLDVGCGSGAFLDLASEAGWTACGCDPDPVAACNTRARGHDVCEGGIESWAAAAGTFDAVTMSHVIEHVHDPVATLRAVFDLLRPGGFLYVDTPNIDASGHGAFGRHWRGLEPPRHLVLFDRDGLYSMLRTQGFETIRPRRRPEVVAGLAEQSARLAAGLDPYGKADTKPPPFLALRVASSLSANDSEFLTLTCRKRA